MKFGVRECANIVFRAKQPIRIGTATFQAGQPVLYIDTATTSSMEQSTTTVYAQGGRGNARLLSWEGQKTLTFSFTDALLSPIGFAILSGAGIFKRGDSPYSDVEDDVHFHMTSGATLEIDATTGKGTIDLRNAIAELGSAAKLCYDDAPIYIMETESDGSLTGNIVTGTLSKQGGVITITDPTINGQSAKAMSVMVDYYVDLPGKHVWEADITPETFGGNYYVEADTLFRDQHTGSDLPANLTFPNVKLQSNFTMTFAGTGDPSTFDFTMDAFPDYTYFDHKKKVLAVMQIVDTIAMGADAIAVQADDPVMYHDDDVSQMAEASAHDSNVTDKDKGEDIKSFKLKYDEDGDNVYATSIPNIGEAISFANFTEVIDKNGNEISLSALHPVYSITSASTASMTNEAAAAKVEVSEDGYILAKGTTSRTPVVVTATLTAATVTTGNKAQSLHVYIGEDVAQG